MKRNRINEKVQNEYKRRSEAVTLFYVILRDPTRQILIFGNNGC